MGTILTGALALCVFGAGLLTGKVIWTRADNAHHMDGQLPDHWKDPAAKKNGFRGRL